jgi:hypothetical protein
MRKRFPIELFALLYLLAYLPYVLAVRCLASVTYPPLGRPLSGLEILPATMILSGALTWIFVLLSGWSKDAHHRKIWRLSLPWPTRWTLLSGIGTSLLLFTVPLSFTFAGVSIPFMQLLMRGDVLLIAPLVDLLSGRKVAWYSWVALIMVGAGLTLTISRRGGLHLPPLAILTVVLYALGYFVRLAVMTKIGKTGDPKTARGYFVEEKLVAIPLAIAALAAISVLGLGPQGGELGFGFVQVWTSNQIGAILVLSGLLVVVSVFSLLILLDPRENTFCVPIERSASVLAGTAAAYILAAMSFSAAPTSAELIGAILLTAAIGVLAIGPRLSGAIARHQ